MTDLIFIAGFLMVGVGLAFWDWRLALVVNGFILMLLAVSGAWRRGR